MKKINQVIIFSAIIFGVLLLSSFASAVIAVITPSSATSLNFSNVTTPYLLINVTFANATDTQAFTYNRNDTAIELNMSTINATFYLENGTDRTRLGNSSTCAIHNATTGIACWGTVNMGLVETLNWDGFYNITAELMNGTAFSGVAHSGTTAMTQNSTSHPNNTRIDNTPPTGLVFNGSVYALANYSDAHNGSIVLNLTFADAGVGFAGQVVFNITNSSGVMHANGTVIASKETDVLIYSTTINTTNFQDGAYNITIAVNDSVGNQNLTFLVVRTFTIDNTDPSVTHTCSPLAVDEDDVISCSCSGSDTHTAVLSTSLTEKPSTSTPGTFTTTCSVIDLVSHTSTSTITYTVEEIGNGDGSSGSSGGSGGGGAGGAVAPTLWAKTYNEAGENLEVGSASVEKSLGEKHRVRVKVSGVEHSVGVVAIVGNKVTIEVAS